MELDAIRRAGEKNGYAASKREEKYSHEVLLDGLKPFFTPLYNWRGQAWSRVSDGLEMMFVCPLTEVKQSGAPGQDCVTLPETA